MSYNISNDPVKKIHVSVTLSPHPLAQVALHHPPRCSVMLLVPQFGVLPRVLDVLGVCSSCLVKGGVSVLHPRCTTALDIA